MQLREWMIPEGARVSDEINKLKQYLIKNSEIESINELVAFLGDKKILGPNPGVPKRLKLTAIFKVFSERLEVLFEDEDLIAVLKPAGLPSQPTKILFEDNAYFRVKEALLGKKWPPKKLPYLGMHHRLDRGTSGILIFTKRASANKHVADLFKERKIQKSYLAVGLARDVGKPKDKWRQKNNITRAFSKKHKFKFEIADKGDEAITEFECLGSLDNNNWLFKCKPITGRTHQIRLQLAKAGYTIKGDFLYGMGKKSQPMFLHAHQLRFKDLSGNIQKAMAPIPAYWGETYPQIKDLFS